ncbi:hypothetical protein K438DRAFT_1950797 [Mycena galopus ATCC 62051]|nr:hypothetical protein K438DRAFT_1950797 [Mycena galopus ATCC 62051]
MKFPSSFAVLCLGLFAAASPVPSRPDTAEIAARRLPDAHAALTAPALPGYLALAANAPRALAHHTNSWAAEALLHVLQPRDSGQLRGSMYAYVYTSRTPWRLGDVFEAREDPFDAVECAVQIHEAGAKHLIRIRCPS